MKNLVVTMMILAGFILSLTAASAQTDTIADPVVITLEQALEIALSENVSVKVADMEIERTGYKTMNGKDNC